MVAVDMHDIYRKVRQDYLIAVNNIEELIIGAHKDNVPYYIATLKRYQQKLIWINKKIDKTWH